jgi:hypothetical protein
MRRWPACSPPAAGPRFCAGFLAISCQPFSAAAGCYEGRLSAGCSLSQHLQGAGVWHSWAVLGAWPGWPGWPPAPPAVAERPGPVAAGPAAALPST